MPFNKSVPKNEISLPKAKPSKEDLDLKKQQKDKIYSRAVFIARDNLTLWIFQQFVGKKVYGQALEQQLECMWQDELSTYKHDHKKKDYGPQLHTRIFLAETDSHNLIEGEFEQSEIPTKFNPKTNSQVPVRFTPKMIVGFQKGQPFRDHIRDNWLPEGLVIKSFWAKDKKGNRIDWAYDFIITRDKGYTSSDWDNEE